MEYKKGKLDVIEIVKNHKSYIGDNKNYGGK